MSNYRPPRKPRLPDPFLGGAMMAVGALIATLFGTCTLMTLGAGKASQTGIFALIWAVIALGGVVLVRAGWRTLRGDRDKSDADGG